MSKGSNRARIDNPAATQVVIRFMDKKKRQPNALQHPLLSSTPPRPPSFLSLISRPTNKYICQTERRQKNGFSGSLWHMSKPLIALSCPQCRNVLAPQGLSSQGKGHGVVLFLRLGEGGL